MSGGKIKMLLVEDEALNYLDIKQFLEDEGFGVLGLPGKMLIDNYDDALLVCENEIPHIAILDIQIKGEKDGLDIATYIRENYYSPVIILSGFDTDENLRRAAIIGIDGFAVKMEKPYNLKQLHAIIRLLLPLAEAAAKRREESIFLSVKEYHEKKTGEDSFNLKRIMLDELMFIKTIAGNKNSVLLQLKNEQKYISHKSLKDFSKELPIGFIRFSGDKIINAKFIDGKGKSPWVYYVGQERFEIADAYRTDELKAILNKLHL
jgi:DNA-binding response OmpR family regulator